MADEPRLRPGTKSWEILAYACEFPGEYTPRTLLDELGWSSFDSMRAMLYKLRKADLIAPAGRQGGRSVYIVPTKLGKKHYRKHSE